MKPFLRILVVSLMGCAAAVQTVRGSADSEMTAVYSVRHGDYQRTKGADGTYRPETYSFGEGGRLNTGAGEASLEGLTFREVARIVAGPLAERSYVSSSDPAATDFVIMVYWGVTDASRGISNSSAYSNLSETLNARANQLTSASNPALTPTGSAGEEIDTGMVLTMVNLENRQRDRANYRNAALLGYHQALSKTNDLRQYAGFGPQRQELVDDVEEGRYFVVLVACDFQTAWKQKKLVPRWTTRFNISARGTDFGRSLPAMAQFASRYFGENSNRLIRKEIPTGSVTVEDAKVIDYDSAPRSDKTLPLQDPQ